MGGAGGSIVEMARERGSSLIVVATHGFTGLQRVMMGSTAEYVLRHSPCPVLVVRRTVSRQASAYAATLAERCGARLTLLHVVPPLTSPRRRPVESSRLNATAVAGAKKELAQLAPRPPGRSGRVGVRVVVGSAAGEIVRQAEKLKVDLMVIATHGRGGIGRILLGSTAEEIVRHAPCPVLVVRRAKPIARSWYNPLIFFPVPPVLP